MEERVLNIFRVDSGIMRIIGICRSKTANLVPVVGIAPENLVNIPKDLEIDKKERIEEKPGDGKRRLSFHQSFNILPNRPSFLNSNVTRNCVTPRKFEDKANLEANHNNFVLVDSSEWGGETTTIMCIIESLFKLNRNVIRVGLLVNGGNISKNEIYYLSQLKIPTIILQGR